mgnify:CR=1 FL=1
MAQYVYTMHRLSKVVPPKREILKNISLSFFPGAKIGVLGLNGAGKSTLLRIMAGVDTEFDGEARPMPGINVGYLPQEPQLDPSKTVREVVEEAVSQIKDAQARLDQVYAAYAEPDADFDALAAEQAKLEAILQASDGHNLERQLEVAADALRLPAWDAVIKNLFEFEAEMLDGKPIYLHMGHLIDRAGYHKFKERVLRGVTLNPEAMVADRIFWAEDQYVANMHVKAVQ